MDDFLIKIERHALRCGFRIIRPFPQQDARMGQEIFAVIHQMPILVITENGRQRAQIGSRPAPQIDNADVHKSRELCSYFKSQMGRAGPVVGLFTQGKPVRAKSAHDILAPLAWVCLTTCTIWPVV